MRLQVDILLRSQRLATVITEDPPHPDVDGEEPSDAGESSSDTATYGASARSPVPSRVCNIQLPPTCLTSAETYAVASNVVELIRLIHHSLNHSLPPPNYRCGKGDAGGHGVYLAPGGYTLVAMFTVCQSTCIQSADVHDTATATTWSFLGEVRALKESAILHVHEKSPGSELGGEGLQYLSPQLRQLLAGAPTLATLLAERPAVLGVQVRRRFPAVVASLVAIPQQEVSAAIPDTSYGCATWWYPV